MRGISFRRLTAAAVLLVPVFLCASASGGDIVSTMRNVHAVGEAQGFRINPAYDAAEPMREGDLALVQAFEVVRPQGRSVTLGRLYTSCVCVQLEAPKRTYGPDERIILQLHNIKPTPLNGQVYAIYVQITSPIRTTLRFDTFVQSNHVMVPEDPDDPSATTPTEIEVIVPDFGMADSLVVDGPMDAPEEAGESDPEAAEIPAEHDAAAEEAGGTEEAPVAETEGAADIPEDEAAGADEEIPAETEDYDELPDLPDEFDSEPLPPPEDDFEEYAAPHAIIPEPMIPTGADAEAEAGPAPESAAPVAASVSEVGKKPLQMISLITIGVRDMPRAIDFYEALGWRRAARNKYDQTAFFQLNGQVLALYPLRDLLNEQNMAGTDPVPGGITLAIHVDGKDDVFAAYDSFIAAGGQSLKPPTEMPSGAVTCYVADPDGNPWEISWVPQFRLDADGGLWLP